jgi:predicted O-methyltransferase YrrM
MNAIEKALSEVTIVPEYSNSKWEMIDDQTAEIEVMETLYALVRCTKPTNILETGTYHGFSSIYMGQALMDNELGGSIDTIEVSKDIASETEARVKRAGLDNIHVWTSSSLEWPLPTNKRYQFASFDSDAFSRGKEFIRFKDLIDVNSIVCFHDSFFDDLTKEVREFEANGLLKVIRVGIGARGVYVCQKT